MKRVGKVHRKTAETEIRLRIDLDGRGKAKITTGIRFFDHMLDLVARHGAFDLTIEAKGDLDVDQHHTVEDVGIALGEAVAQAIGNKKGILRAGYFLMPMDETLAAAAVERALRKFGATPERVSTAEALAGASAIVLPGQGHYAALIRALDERAMRAPLVESLSHGKPFLGICLGLQALYQSSEEAPDMA